MFQDELPDHYNFCFVDLTKKAEDKKRVEDNKILALSEQLALPSIDSDLSQFLEEPPPRCKEFRRPAARAKASDRAA